MGKSLNGLLDDLDLIGRVSLDNELKRKVLKFRDLQSEVVEQCEKLQSFMKKVHHRMETFDPVVIVDSVEETLNLQITFCDGLNSNSCSSILYKGLVVGLKKYAGLRKLGECGIFPMRKNSPYDDTNVLMVGTVKAEIPAAYKSALIKMYDNNKNTKGGKSYGKTDTPKKTRKTVSAKSAGTKPCGKKERRQRNKQG